jgi:putative transcription factor
MKKIDFSKYMYIYAEIIIMAHQDWETVVFKKRPNQTEAIKAAQRSGNTESIKKTDAGNRQNSTIVNSYKIDNIDSSEQKLSLKMIDTKATEAIRKKRCELKLSQKELANKAQVPESVIKSLENNKEQHNPPLLTKIQRVLGIKLLGQNIGEPL